MPFTEMITILAIGLFFLLAFIYFLRLLQAWMLHRTLRDAIVKDSVHAGMLVDRIEWRPALVLVQPGTVVACTGVGSACSGRGEVDTAQAGRPSPPMSAG